MAGKRIREPIQSDAVAAPAIQREERITITLTVQDLEAGARVMAAQRLIEAGYGVDEAQAMAQATKIFWETEHNVDLDCVHVTGATLLHTNIEPVTRAR